MKRFLSVVSILLVAAGTASADHYQKYWKGSAGDSWTFSKSNPVAKFAPYTVTLQQSFAGLGYVKGLPGWEDGVWLGWGGNTLYAWDAAAAQWRTFLRFGAAIGTKYAINLGVPFWSNVQVTVKNKYAQLYDPHVDQKFKNCVRFLFVNNSVADAGVTEMLFAPGIGPVHLTETSLIGNVDWMLMSAVLGGKNWGAVVTSALDQGPKTQFPGNDAQVLVYNDVMAWNSFWNQHKPGTAAPAVDFEKQSAIVVIAGWRPNWGYSISSQSVRWNYPQKSVNVSILETVPTGPQPNPMSKPYVILATNTKVSSVTTTWTKQ